MVDTGFYHCKKYYLKKKPVFSKYAKDCQQTVITDKELHARSEKIRDRIERRVSPITFYDKEENPV